MKKSSRRKFIISSATVGIGSMLATPVLGKLFAAENSTKAISSIGFDQQPLAYAYNALEPSIDGMTMDIHFNKHAAAYCKNVKEAAIAEGVDMKKPIEDVLASISKYSVKMRNNAGGHFNHELFWRSLTPKAGTQPSEKLGSAINKQFGSLEAFQKQFSDAAKGRFGSGWAWLLVNGDKKLVISSTPNQDNPLMDIADVKGFPVVGLDVWEHAYYLKYQNKRADYIDGFWKVLNWDFVSERFNTV
jgi:Fe-Mn family superoxide dismutase